MTSAHDDHEDPAMAADSTERITLALGRLAHIVIAERLAAGDRTPDSRALTRAAQVHSKDGPRSVHPHALVQQLAVSAAVYFRLFLLDEQWRFVASEMSAGNCRFDLVFTDGRSFRVDELKTRRASHERESEPLSQQLARQCAAGEERWGKRFFGVRGVVLGAPRASRLLRPGSQESELQWQAWS